MAYRLRCLSLMLAAAMTPGIARAQAVMGQTAIGAADVPPVRITIGPDYRLKNPEQQPDRPRSGKAAMLERLFAPATGFAMSDRHHVSAFTIGGIEIAGEAMRERLLTGSGSTDRHERTVERLWTAGAHADWAAGANDRLSLGAAIEAGKRDEPTILTGRTNIKGSALATEITWAHDGHLLMSLGWRDDRPSSAYAGAERLVEIAHGAALREQGARLTIRYLLDGGDRVHSAMFGIAARAERIAADDLATIGSGNRRDVQAGLFFRALF